MASSVSLDMVEVASSNLAGPTKIQQSLAARAHARLADIDIAKSRSLI